MSFKDRFKDRQEVVGRDGTNSFSHRSSVSVAPGGNKGAANRTRVPLIPPQQQQPPASDYGAPSHQQQQYQQQPSYAPSANYGAQPSVAGSQPSFFMTGGGFAASPSPAPAYSSAAGANAYGIPQAPPAHLPPLSNPPPQQQQQQQQADYGSQQHITTPPHQQQQQQQQQQQARRGFAQNLVGGGGGAGPSPTAEEMSPGRRERRKEMLPDFHELEVLDASRRQGRGHVERMPVLVDHPVSGEYHQHTLSEYKRMMKEVQTQRFGGLGAEDNEQKQAEREKRRKMSEYGKQVNAVNFAVLDQLMGDSWHNRPIEKKLDTDAQLAKIKRERAKMYADAVKPPVVSARKQSPPKAKTPQPGLSASARALDTDVESLEEKHRRDQEAIRRIKAQLNMV